jgi:uncharacterized protein
VTSDQNKAILAAVFADTAAGKGGLFVDTLHDDVRWTIIGTTPWSKTYVGKTSVINDLLRPLGRQLGGTNIIRASRILPEGDYAVVEAAGHNVTASGQKYENQYCWVIRMLEGKMAELTEYADTQLIACVLQDPKVGKVKSAV